ncbi:MAG: ABC transporter ATP-binding protein, partial [Aeromicrobium sp.]
GTFVKSSDTPALANALTVAGVSAVPSGDNGLRTESAPAEVGRIAAAAGVALIELRPADGAGLEEMFLELTAETQRDENTPEGVKV